MSAPPRLRVLEALRHRDFRLLWSGQTVSQIGDAAFIVALGWRAFTLTGKASSLGIVLMVEALGLVTTLLIGGVLADRYSRRLLLIGSDLARALLIAGLAVVDATGHLRFGFLIAFVALHGLGSGLFQPAFGGILPLLIEEPSIGSANALIGVSRQAAFVIGPALAGLIYGTAGSSAIFAADAASFVVSAALLAPARPRVYEQGPAEGLRRWDTMVMQRVPQHMLSRVISMDWFGSIGLLPAGLGIWAVLSGLAAPGTLIAASMAFSALLFLLGLADRRIRSVD